MQWAWLLQRNLKGWFPDILSMPRSLTRTGIQCQANTARRITHDECVISKCPYLALFTSWQIAKQGLRGWTQESYDKWSISLSVEMVALRQYCFGFARFTLKEMNCSVHGSELSCLLLQLKWYGRQQPCHKSCKAPIWDPRRNCYWNP